MTFHFRPSTLADAAQIHDLYLKIAETNGGIIRIASEVTPQYIGDFLEKSGENGLGFVAEVVENQGFTERGKIVAEIHGYVPPLSAFRHVITELTIVTHPDFQGKGIGRQLFQLFLFEIENNRPDILRVELFVRKNNVGAVALYEKLGFKIEGALTNTILNADGSLETPLLMAWFNPSFRVS